MELDTSTFKKVLGHFCSGVVIVTGHHGGEPVGFTAQSFSALSLDPPLILFCAAHTSTTWPRLKASGRFCVHVLGHDQEALCRSFATPGADKYASVEWSVGPYGNPVLPGCVAYIESELKGVYREGDHDIAVGSVTDLALGEPAEPLLFYQGTFRRLVS